jgi:DNA mismatch repair ATPase MutS
VTSEVRHGLHSAHDGITNTSASFRSLLFDGPARPTEGGERAEPAYFSDLNLDQVLATVTAGHEEYDLTPFFYEQLGDIGTIHYRQEVFRDLEHTAVFETIQSFATKMHDTRVQLAQAFKLRHRYQQECWLLDAAERYCDAVASLARELMHSTVRSQGLLAFRDYVSSYAESAAFATLVADIKHTKDELATVHYSVHVRGLRVRVQKYESELDYSEEVLETFERFKHGAAKDYRVGFRNPLEMNSVEARTLDLVAQLFPEVSAVLDDCSTRHRDFLDETIIVFDREVQFYVSYLNYIEPVKSAGLSFCYPEVSRESKEVFAEKTFDLALASKLASEKRSVVCNDFFLAGPERIFVVSGPNQGGKTTFARVFGQLHHLASLGYPVPGRKARLFHLDRLFTHFGKEEYLSNFRGKLEDDLVRIREILVQATPNSVILINEIFASTTLSDALFLAKNVLEKIIELDLLCVYVSFIEELTSLSESTVSMVSTIDPGNPTERTYKVVRRPADGLAYAIALAEKYGLTYERLTARIMQ